MTRAGLVAICGLLAGCHKPAGVVARLEAMTAQVERMAGRGSPWGAAHVGETFVLGGAVRTAAASYAKLRLGHSGKLDVGPESVVYFTDHPGDERRDLRVETGSVEVETGDEPVGIGDAVLEAHGRAQVHTLPGGPTIVVTLGSAHLESDPGVAIKPGQQVTLPPNEHPIITVVGSPADAATAAARGGLKLTVTGKPATIGTPTGQATLAPGEHDVEPGAAITAGEGTTIEVTRGGAHALAVGPGTLHVAPDPATLVNVITGAITLHGDGADAVAVVPGGRVTARAGGEAAAEVGGGSGTVIDGRRGETRVEGAHGGETLAAGESATLATDGTVEKAPPPPAQAVVAITAGESPVLHDPKGPTAVHVDVGATCTTGGVVEVARDRAFKAVLRRSPVHDGGANVSIPAGSYSYRLRCDAGPGARGTIRIDHDSGRTPLPKAAAHTLVEIDGREYTVLYQNLLPELTLSWHNAPHRASYTFVVKTSGGGEKRFPSSASRVQLRAGQLGEGSYKLWVEADGGARSEDGRLVIEFDNAAPSASIDAIEAADGKVHVKGTVIEGSTVSAAGAAVGLDRHRRFDAELAPAAGADGVAVRIAHPKLGVHYYVMRTGPS